MTTLLCFPPVQPIAIPTYDLPSDVNLGSKNSTRSLALSRNIHFGHITIQQGNWERANLIGNAVTAGQS